MKLTVDKEYINYFLSVRRNRRDEFLVLGSGVDIPVLDALENRIVGYCRGSIDIPRLYRLSLNSFVRIVLCEDTFEESTVKFSAFVLDASIGQLLVQPRGGDEISEGSYQDITLAPAVDLCTRGYIITATGAERGLIEACILDTPETKCLLL
jgi:hypothetical protein